MTLYNSDIIFPQLHTSAVLNHFTCLHYTVHTVYTLNHIAVFNNSQAAAHTHTIRERERDTLHKGAILFICFRIEMNMIRLLTRLFFFVLHQNTMLCMRTLLNLNETQSSSLSNIYVNMRSQIKQQHQPIFYLANYNNNSKKRKTQQISNNKIMAISTIQSI